MNARADATKAVNTLTHLVTALTRRRFTVAFIGEAGSGKSSLINRMVGSYVAPIGAIETTMDATRHLVPESPFVLVDLPGYGTTRWPTTRYVDDLQLEQYDYIVMVYSARVKNDDVDIVQELIKRGKPYFVVRNYMDVALQGEAIRSDGPPADFKSLRTHIEQDARIQFRSNTLRLYAVSAHPDQPTYELSDLMLDLQEQVKDYTLTQISACIQDQSRLVQQTSAWKRTQFFTRLAAATMTLNIPYAHRTVGMMVTANALGLADST